MDKAQSTVGPAGYQDKIIVGNTVEKESKYMRATREVYACVSELEHEISLLEASISLAMTPEPENYPQEEAEELGLVCSFATEKLRGLSHSLQRMYRQVKAMRDRVDL